eukprot:1137030-Pelagomonas_calceolata.AAC.1
MASNKRQGRRDPRVVVYAVRPQRCTESPPCLPLVPFYMERKEKKRHVGRKTLPRSGGKESRPGRRLGVYPSTGQERKERHWGLGKALAEPLPTGLRTDHSSWFTWGFGLQPVGWTAQPAVFCQPHRNVHDLRKKVTILVLLNKMTIVLIANLRIAKSGRTKGNSRLWRSLKQEVSVLVPETHQTYASFPSGEGDSRLFEPRAQILAQEEGMFFALQILQIT